MSDDEEENLAYHWAIVQASQHYSEGFEIYRAFYSLGNPALCDNLFQIVHSYIPVSENTVCVGGCERPFNLFPFNFEEDEKEIKFDTEDYVENSTVCHRCLRLLCLHCCYYKYDDIFCQQCAPVNSFQNHPFTRLRHEWDIVKYFQQHTTTPVDVMSIICEYHDGNVQKEGEN